MLTQSSPHSALALQLRATADSGPAKTFAQRQLVNEDRKSTGPTHSITLVPIKNTRKGTSVVTREELYELVWSMPMVKVAEKFEVSGSYLARVCTELMVPRPDRGYWAKLSVGKAPPRPALPEPLAGFAVAWSRTEGFQAPTLPTPRQTPRPGSSQPIRPVVGAHGLIRGARELFLVGSTLNDDEHLRPSKQLMVDITASHSGLDKALGFANDLFNALESAGHRVVIAPATAQFRRGRIEAKELTPKNESAHDSYENDRRWSPYRPTVALVDSVAFGLAVIEMTEPVEMRYVNGKYIRESEYVPSRSRRYRHHASISTSTKDLPSGRLRLVVYAPYGAVSWSTSFQETKGRTLTPDIPKIVRAIGRARSGGSVEPRARCLECDASPRLSSLTMQVSTRSPLDLLGVSWLRLE